jgi:hypothetical protein
MADNMNGQTGDWMGFILTGILLGISSITLSDVALVCTAVAGLSTAALNVYKYIQHKKRNHEKNLRENRDN